MKTIKNRKLLAKNWEYSDLATGGKLSPQDAAAFITYVFDEGAELFREVQTKTMTSETANIDLLEIATRQLRKKLPGTSPLDFVNPTFTRNVLTAVKMIYPFDIEDEWLEENIEREGGMETALREAGIALSNDMLDLAWNGDEAGVGDFITINDGWLALGLASGNVYDATLDTSEIDIFHAMLQAMPRWFKTNKSNLRYYVSPEFEENYRKALSERSTSMGDSFLDEDRQARYQGIKVIPMGPMPYANAVLVQPKNLCFGLRKQFTLETDRDIYAQVTQVAMSLSADFQIAVDSGIVVAHSIPAI